jgi:hypothetical protein
MSTATAPQRVCSLALSSTLRIGASTLINGPTTASGIRRASVSTHAGSALQTREPWETDEAITQAPDLSPGAKPPHMPKLRMPQSVGRSAAASGAVPKTKVRTVALATILASN